MAYDIPEDQKFGAMGNPNYFGKMPPLPTPVLSGLPAAINNYGKDLADQTAFAYKKGGGFAAAGTLTRGLAAAPLAVGAGALQPVWDGAMQFGKAVTGDPTGGGNTAATKNAVNASSPSAYPVKSAYGDSTDNTGVSNYTPPSAPTGPTMTDNVGGISGVQKFVGPDGKTTYTNLGLPGYQDIQNARGPGNALPSVPGFLSGVKNTSDFYPPTGGGAAASGGNNATQSYIQQLQSAGMPALLNSKGMASNWRGRMFMNQANKLIAGQNATDEVAANTANAASRRITVNNEMPIAKMHDFTQQQGHAFQLAPHLPTLQLQGAALERLNAGDLAGAHQLMTLGAPRPGFQPHPFSVHSDPITGRTVLNPNTGAVSTTSPKELAQEEAERTLNAARNKIANKS